MTGINQVLKICWEIINKFRNINKDNDNHTDNKIVLQALALINDCNKYDLTTNGVIITECYQVCSDKQREINVEERRLWYRI